MGVVTEWAWPRKWAWPRRWAWPRWRAGGLRARCGGAAAARRLRGAATATGTAAEGPGPGPSPPGESRTRSRSRAQAVPWVALGSRGGTVVAPWWHRGRPRPSQPSRCAPVAPVGSELCLGAGHPPALQPEGGTAVPIPFPGALCSASPQRRGLPELFPNSPAGLPGIAQLPVAPGCLRDASGNGSGLRGLRALPLLGDSRLPVLLAGHLPCPSCPLVAPWEAAPRCSAPAPKAKSYGVGGLSPK